MSVDLVAIEESRSERMPVICPMMILKSMKQYVRDNARVVGFEHPGKSDASDSAALSQPRNVLSLQTERCWEGTNADQTVYT